MASRALRLYQLAGGPSGWLDITAMLARSHREAPEGVAISIGGSVMVIGTTPGGRVISSRELGELIFVADEIDRQRIYERFPGFAPAPGWAVVDAGANSGMFAVRAARLGARVLAFEPNPDCCRWLRKSVVANGLESRVSLFECALGSRAEAGSLDVSQGTLGARIQAGEASGKLTPISIRRLDDVVRELDIERVDLLKLDVEGHEVAALEGAATTLEIVDRVVLEYHSHQLLKDCTDLLGRHALVPAGVDDLHPELGYGNAFFRRVTVSSSAV
jgi:FkbM family methyltransferase